MGHISNNDILGVIFCGGQALRLGGLSKMTIKLGGQSLLSHAATHLQSHVAAMALSVKPDTPLPIIREFEIIYDSHDESVAFALLSALKHAKDRGYGAILTLPVDTPFLPGNYAAAMISASKDTSINLDCVYAQYNGRIQGLHSLWKTSVYDELEVQIMKNKTYKISNLYDKTLSTSCIFTDVDKASFLNINTPETLKLAQDIIAAP